MGKACEYPPPVAPPFIPNTGPREGSLRHAIDFFPIFLRASVRPTVVVVFPSPAGVGLMAVIRISFAFFLRLGIELILAICLPNVIKLVDFKVEFGKTKSDETIILADEISPDTCRLWDQETDKKLDKDRFRKDLGNIIDAYQEVARRLGILHEQSNIRPIKFSKPTAVKIKKSK